MATSVPILAFNDVYRVHQRYVAQPGCPVPSSEFPSDAEIRVSQFAQLVYDLRAEWPLRKPGTAEGGSDDDGRDGLFLFAGDVFSPSVESSVTRGSHMVPVLNAIKVDAACVGNHDFDFGYPHMTKLVGATNFPWLLSNVIDDRTGKTPAPLHRFVVEERCGVRIGLVGLVEEDWIATIPSWPSHFRYRPMREVGLELSELLRDPEGEYRVDLIIALTHSRVPNDIKLANELGAVNRPNEIRDKHGVDLIIGGHDHIYYIGTGAAEWDGFSGEHGKPGTEDDKGCMIIKSGTDFRDLSSANLQLSPPDDQAIRRRVIERLTGKHHYVIPSSASNKRVDRMMDRLLSTVTKTLTQPVCFSVTPFDARSEVVRTRESSLGNWTADVLLHAYDESLFDKKIVISKNPEFDPKTTVASGADCTIICGGTLRGDSQYGPGKIGLGDIIEIFPFDDAVVCLEIDGEGLWQTLENGFSRWPAQEGRFPIVAGLAVQWDSTAPPGQRVKSVHLTQPPEGEDMEDPVEFVDTQDGARLEVRQARLRLGDAVPNVKGGRVYRVITRQYMADGFDGFGALKDRRMLVDHETGTSISNIIRSFLLGSAYIMRKKQLVEDEEEFDVSHGGVRKDTNAPSATASANAPSAIAPAPSAAAATATNSASTQAQAGYGEKARDDGWRTGTDGTYFGTKTPLVLRKYRARTAPARAHRAPRRPPGVYDISREIHGHMPGGTEDVRTGEHEPDSPLVAVNEVEFPTHDALSSNTAEAPGRMPGSTSNVVTGQPDALTDVTTATTSNTTATTCNTTTATNATTTDVDVAEDTTETTEETEDTTEDATEEVTQEGKDNWGSLRHHVVQHDWTFIKEAMYLAKHEHMADVDSFRGDKVRRYCPVDSEAPTPAATTGTATPMTVALQTPADPTLGQGLGAGLAKEDGQGKEDGQAKGWDQGGQGMGQTKGGDQGGQGTGHAKAATQGTAGGTTGLAPVTPGMECGEKCQAEIASLDNDLAIVSPMVDGRLKDTAGQAVA